MLICKKKFHHTCALKLLLSDFSLSKSEVNFSIEVLECSAFFLANNKSASFCFNELSTKVDN
jgi:hypothetical protein